MPGLKQLAALILMPSLLLSPLAETAGAQGLPGKPPALEPTPPQSSSQQAPSLQGPSAAPRTGQPQAESGGTVVGGAERIVMSPVTARVGQKISITLANFPQPNSDILVVVPAGAPETDPQSGPNPLFRQRIYSPITQPIEVGPFAPGSYELRYFTTLYNNERRYEVSARGGFSVSR